MLLFSQQESESDSQRQHTFISALCYVFRLYVLSVALVHQECAIIP
jgi:hypothetical protein